MKAKESGTAKCLMPECDNPAMAGCRGLCGACRQLVQRMIRKGETTMEKLVRKRLVLPARPGRHSLKADKVRAAIKGK